MKNKEIEELLNNFHEVLNNPTYTDEIYNGKLIEFDRSYDLEQDEIKLLLSYIEQLENNKEKEYVLVGRMQLKTRDYIHQLEKENKQLENNRDKAIEYFKFENPEIFKNPKYTNHLWTIDGLTIKRFIDILKGDSDD